MRFALLIIIVIMLGCSKSENSANNASPNNNNFLAILTTLPVGTVSNGSAVSGGVEIGNAGGDQGIIMKGVCWSLSPNPTINDNKTNDGGGGAIYNSILTGILPNTTYYVKAYATNNYGTGYGDQVTFTTDANNTINQNCFGISNLIDFDGNVYQVVKIGTQCWMKENLRVKHYRNGTPISNGNGTTYNSPDIGYYFYPNSDPINEVTLGLLYNYKAMSSGAEPLCPLGWRVSNRSDYEKLIIHLGGVNKAQYALEKFGLNYWNAPVPSTNSSGFTALHAGGMGSGGNAQNFDLVGYYGTSTPGPYNSNIYYMGSTGIINSQGNKRNGFSCRCVAE